MKYFSVLILFSFLVINCQNTEPPKHTNSYKVPEKPITKKGIDSVKFQKEIYRLDTLFQKLYKANQFNANVLIAKGNEIIYQQSFGYCIKEKNELLNDSTLFQLASVSKVITGISVMLLYEQGKLKLNQSVQSILPTFPFKDITIQHLLSHRTGIPNYTYFCSEFLKDETTVLSNQDVLDVISKYQPTCYYKPNTRFSYSNTNYVLLALIIEKISGKAYSTFLQDELFLPLGMNRSFTATNLDFTKKNISKGYTQSYKLVANDRFDGVLGDKGIYTTTYDLFLLSTALYQHKLLSTPTQELAYSPYCPEKKLSNYGLGWRMKNWTTKDKELFHNGWWHGYRSAFHRRLNDSLTVIVLSNRLNKSVYATWRIYDAIDGKSSLTTKNESGDE